MILQLLLVGIPADSICNWDKKCRCIRFLQPMQRQSKLVVPILTSFTKNEKKRVKLKEKLKAVFEMNDETADRFIGCFSIFDPVTIKTNTILICSPGFRMTSMWSTRRFISYMPIRWERNISNGIKRISVPPISASSTCSTSSGCPAENDTPPRCLRLLTTLWRCRYDDGLSAACSEGIIRRIKNACNVRCKKEKRKEDPSPDAPGRGWYI